MTRARDELILSHATESAGRAGAARLAVRHRGARPADGRLRAARHSRRRCTPRGPLQRIAAAEGPAEPPEARAHADRGPAPAQPLRDRRLPDLPAPVQVRAGGAACRRRRTTRWSTAPRSTRPSRSSTAPRRAAGRSTEPELLSVFEAAWSNEGFVSREHETARLEAGRASLRRFREEQLQPGAVVPGVGRARVRVRARRRSGPRPVRPRGHRPGRRAVRRTSPARCWDVADAPSRPPRGRRRADARAARAGGGDDHRLQVERRARSRGGTPAGARFAPAPDLRDGLRGDDRAPARRGPAALPGLGARRAGGGRAGAAREGARRRSRPPRRASAPATTRRGRARSACTYCPFRDICPSSAASLGGRGPARGRGDHASTSATRWSASTGRGCAAVVEADRRRRSSRRGIVRDRDGFLVAWAEERERQFREEVPQFREVDIAQRAVRVLARLRGMAPPPPERALGRRGGRGARRAGRRSTTSSRRTAPRSSSGWTPVADATPDAPAPRRARLRPRRSSRTGPSR